MSLWNIETDAPEPELRAFLSAHAPWRVDFTFNNALRSADFGTRQPFTAAPLHKLTLLKPHVPAAVLAGRVLDVGTNLGYNAIHLAQTYGARVLGIDTKPDNIEVAKRISGLSGADVDVRIADAETFRTDDPCDLVLHLGTLYHLPNPYLALATASANLRPGGYLALETTAYIAGSDPHENLWINGFNGDPTNFWALGKPTIEAMLGMTSFVDVALVKEVHMDFLEGRMSRVMYVAKRA